MKPTLRITLMLLLSSFTFAVAKDPIQPKHDGEHFFIRPAAVVPVDPTVSDIDRAIAKATAEGRIVNVVSGGLDIPSAMKQVASLPVTFRSTIDGWNYDITVLSMDFTQAGSKLTVGCKFTLQDNPNGPAIYFAGTDIAASGKNGFKGEMNIVGTTLSNAKNNELTPVDMALLNGKTAFHEFPLPHFNATLWMGLDEDSKVSFSCGAFDKFTLSGFVKSYNTVVQEELSGASAAATKPLVLAFGATEVRDWQDMYFPVRTARGFHAKSYADLGFHFASGARILLDLSKRQNPPNLPSCASAAGSYWQGIYFEKFDVRLPNFFKMTNGGDLPFGKGSNLFIDNNGLIGNMVTEKVFRLSEGFTESGQQNYPMSLEKIAANFSCGGKVNAQMEGNIQLPTCGTTTEDPILIGYTFTFAENLGYSYLLNNGEANKSMGSNVVRLSTGSTLTFAINNGVFNITGTYPTTPTLTSNSYNNSICKDFATRLTVSNCSNSIAWENGDAATEVTRSPIVTTNYSVRCYDKYCISATSVPITITVYESLAKPTLTASTTDATFCANRNESITASDNCVGQLQWITPELETWTVLGSPTTAGDHTVTISYPNLTEEKEMTYKVKCALNDCASEIDEKTFTITPAPTNPTLTRFPDVDVVCSGSITLSASNCINGTLHWFHGNHAEDVTLRGKTSYVLNQEGENGYYVKCMNANGCLSEASPLKFVTYNKCFCKPASPTIQLNQPNVKVCTGTIATIYARGCTGSGKSIKWYRNNGEFIETSPSLSRSSGAWDQYFARCVDDRGCESELSNGVQLEFIDCPLPPPSITASPSATEHCKGTKVTLTAHNCPGKIQWFNNASAPLGTGANYEVPLNTNDSYFTTCINDQGVSSITSSAISITYIDCPLPPPSITASPSATEYCKGTKVTLTAQGCSGTVQWYNNSSVPLGTGTSYDVPLNINDSYFTTCINDQGYSSITSSAISINYIDCTTPPSNPSCSDYTWNVPVVNGCSVTVGTNYTGGVQIYDSFTKAWHTTNSHTIEVVQNGTYYFDYKLDNNCSATGGRVTVSSCNTTTPPTGGCSGKPTTPIWINTGDTCINNVSYIVEKDTNPCSNSYNRTQAITLGGTACSVNPPGCTPPDAATVSASKNEVCSGEEVTLSASGCASGNYNWILGHQMGSKAASVKVYPTSTRKYTVDCIKEPGCYSTSEIEVKVKTKPSIEIAASSLLLTSANPTSTLRVTGCDNGSISWSSVETSDNIVVSYPNVYKATCNFNECSFVSTAQTTVRLKIQAPTLNVYPNCIFSREVVNVTASCPNLDSELKWESHNSSGSIELNTNTTFSASCHYKYKGASKAFLYVDSDLISTNVEVVNAKPSSPDFTGDNWVKAKEAINVSGSCKVGAFEYLTPRETIMPENKSTLQFSGKCIVGCKFVEGRKVVRSNRVLIKGFRRAWPASDYYYESPRVAYSSTEVLGVGTIITGPNNSLPPLINGEIFMVLDSEDKENDFKINKSTGRIEE